MIWPLLAVVLMLAVAAVASGAVRLRADRHGLMIALRTSNRGWYAGWHWGGGCWNLRINLEIEPAWGWTAHRFHRVTAPPVPGCVSRAAPATAGRRRQRTYGLRMQICARETTWPAARRGMCRPGDGVRAGDIGCRPARRLWRWRCR